MPCMICITPKCKWGLQNKGHYMPSAIATIPCCWVSLLYHGYTWRALKDLWLILSSFCQYS